MSCGGIVLVALGLVLSGVGMVALRSKQPLPRAWQPGDKVSMIELGMSAVDPNFVPAGEMRWEQQLNRLLCWFGFFVGVALVCVGLWYGLNS
jgi:hypothetical protein